MDARFTDQQMAFILKRATELQASGDEPTHTLAEIQEIALQVGLDPVLIAEAAATLPPPDETPYVQLFGAPSACRVSRNIPATMRPSDQGALVATIRDHLPQVGVVKEFTGRFEWYAGQADNKTSVTVSPSSNGTVVRIDGRYPAIKIFLYCGAGLATLVVGALGMEISPAIDAVLELVALGVSFASARSIWNGIAHRKRRQFDGLLEALGEQLQRADSTS